MPRSGLSVLLFRIIRYLKHTLPAHETTSARNLTCCGGARGYARRSRRRSRQAGKSTLCTRIASERACAIVTLDDANTRRGAIDDPEGFVAGLGERAFIDELQRAPELVLALKMERRQEPRPGSFLVSGSASLLLAPRIGDSLAGRIERMPLRPFTQAEIARAAVPVWLDELWKGAARHMWSRSISAGPPTQGASQRAGFRLRSPAPNDVADAWFEDYLAALVARDVPDLVDVRRPDLLPALLCHLAAGSGSLMSMRPIAQALAADEKTVRAYVRLLELLHLLVRVPAWAPGFAARAVRAPRLFIEDSGPDDPPAGRRTRRE